MPIMRHWTVRTDDGHCFELKVSGPKNPRAAILFLPAMGVPARYYAPLAEALEKAELMLVRAELRGIGTSSLRPRRGVDFGYRHILESDLPAALETLRARAPNLPVYLAGHSLGGQLALLYAASTAPEVAGVLMIACGSPYYECWAGRQRLGLLLARIIAPALGTVMGYVPGKRLGIGSEREATTLMRDWAANARTGQYLLRRSQVDYEAALAKYEGKVLAIAIEGDELARGAAIDFMLDKVPRAQSRRVDVELSARKPRAHFRWVREPNAVVSAMLSELEGPSPHQESPTLR